MGFSFRSGYSSPQQTVMASCVAQWIRMDAGRPWWRSRVADWLAFWLISLFSWLRRAYKVCKREAWREGCMRFGPFIYCIACVTVSVFVKREIISLQNEDSPTSHLSLLRERLFLCRMKILLRLTLHRQKPPMYLPCQRLQLCIRQMKQITSLLYGKPFSHTLWQYQRRADCLQI